MLSYISLSIELFGPNVPKYFNPDDENEIYAAIRLIGCHHTALKPLH